MCLWQRSWRTRTDIINLHVTSIIHIMFTIDSYYYCKPSSISNHKLSLRMRQQRSGHGWKTTFHQRQECHGLSDDGLLAAAPHMPWYSTLNQISWSLAMYDQNPCMLQDICASERAAWHQQALHASLDVQSTTRLRSQGHFGTGCVQYTLQFDFDEEFQHRCYSGWHRVFSSDTL